MRASNISHFVLIGGIERIPWLFHRFSCLEEGLEIFERKPRKNQPLLFNKVIAASASTQVDFISETDIPEIAFIKRSELPRENRIYSLRLGQIFFDSGTFNSLLKNSRL